MAKYRKFGGIRINARKTPQQVEEQMNRIAKNAGVMRADHTDVGFYGDYSFRPDTFSDFRNRAARVLNRAAKAYDAAEGKQGNRDMDFHYSHDGTGPIETTSTIRIPRNGELIRLNGKIAVNPNAWKVAAKASVGG